MPTNLRLCCFSSPDHYDKRNDDGKGDKRAEDLQVGGDEHGLADQLHVFSIGLGYHA